jgi:beta-lactam-binding protein with PASTA domain
MKFDFKKFSRDTFGGILLHIFLAFVLLVVLSILYFYVYLPSTTNHGESITVPNVEGMPLSQLEDELGKRTLRYEVDSSSYSSEHPPLTVFKQYPQAGAKVKEGRKIFVSINRMQPPTVPVPNLIDGSVVNADAVLRSNELKRGRIELVSGPFNVVKEMKYRGRKIEPNTVVPKGSVIDLVVMDGGNGPIEAPNVVGMTVEDAKIPILGMNLNMGDIILVGGDTTGQHAVILKQKPTAGENIKVGDVVDLWVGKPGSSIDDEDNDQ